MYPNIFAAICANNKKAVLSFLEKGVDVFSTDPESGRTPSDLAADLEFIEILELLVEEESEALSQDKKLPLTSSLLSNYHDRLPASHSQQRFYFLHEFLDDPSAYHEYMLVEYKGDFHLDIFKIALTQLIQRHESLRTQLMLDQHNHVVQEILPHLSLPLEIADAATNTAFTLENYLITQKSFIKKHFSLDQAPLWRIKLFQTSPNTCYTLFVFHHAIIDGFSIPVLLKNLLALYHDYINSIQNPLPPAVQYRDYCAYENAWEKTSERSSQLNYWQKRLLGYESNIEVPGDLRAQPSISISLEKGHTLVLPLEKSLYEAILAFSKKTKVTPFSTYLTAYFILLSKYTQQTDIVVGTPFFNRSLDKSDSAVGCFINTLPIRSQIECHQSFSLLVQSIYNDVQNDLCNGQLPYNELLKQGYFERKGDADSLVQTMFIYQLGLNGLALDATTHSLPFKATIKNIAHHTPDSTQFPISLEMLEYEQNIYLVITYRGDLYSQKFIENVFSHYGRILEHSIAHPECLIKDIPMLTLSEMHEQSITWNHTAHDYPQWTLHQLFEQQVERIPNNTAIIFEDLHLSYRQLNEKANQLAHYLIEHYQIKPDDLVALYVERSEHMLIAIFAVLKAGGAYVPIDPDFPAERTAYILKDTATKIVLTTTAQKKNLTTITGIDQFKMLVMDNEIIRTDLLKQSVNNPVALVTPKNLANVIYTSGTTGHPKGVMIEHRGVVNRIHWMNDAYPLNASDKILQKTPYTFDVSVWELLWANMYGAIVVFAKPQGHRDATYLIDLIQKESISVIHFVPSMFNVFLEVLENLKHHALEDAASNLSSLKYVFCSGEELMIHQVKQSHYLLPQVALVNLYGPTEASIDVLYFDCSGADTNTVYIGKPIHNTAVYILDTDQKLLPLGAVGELYIGGDGVARGYLNKAELTADRFISNPFQTEEEKQEDFFGEKGRNAILYKTGDLVKYSPQSQIKYEGRNDFQVKIRGHRIECGEIEAVLSGHDEIKQSIVLEKNHKNVQGQKYLVGYYVADRVLDQEKMRQYLKSRLPDYMVPSIFVRLDKLPLSLNGKCDRKALPEPEFANTNIRELVSPRSDLEKQLCKIWFEVLNIEKDKLGIYDDFFSLGGDSISAIRLVSKINTVFSTTLNVREIFECRSIAQVAQRIHASNSSIIYPPYTPFSLISQKECQEIMAEFDDIQDIYPASYLQKGMLLESSLHKSTYHDVFCYSIAEKYDAVKCLTVWKALASKHALLRASFRENATHGWVILIHRQVDVSLHTKIKADSAQCIEQERLNDFGYSQPGLFRLIVNDNSESFDFIFSFHHAIMDGWSVASLIHEFVQDYVYGQVNDIKNPLSYGEFVRNEMQAIQRQDSLSFWKNYLKDLAFTRASWKFDTEHSQNSLLVTSFDLSLSEAITVDKLVKKHHISKDTIFLLAYLKTIAFFTNQSNVTIGLVVNNRLEKEGGDALLGLFLNTIPFRHNFTNTVDNSLIDILNHKIHLQKYQQLPYGMMRSLFKHNLYAFAFNFVHFHVLEQSLNNITVFQNYERTNIPFALNVIQKDEETFTIRFVVHDDYISKDFLEYFSKYYKISLSSVLAEVKEPLALTIEDQHQLLHTWNQTKKPYPNTTIHQLFEAQVERTPDAIALVYEDQTLTYRKLNARANQVAHYLRAQGMKPDQLVGLGIERSLEMIIGILAILKAGGAYVPLDPSLPEERLRHMLEDTQVSILLTQDHLKLRWQTFIATQTLTIIALDESDFYRCYLRSNLENIAQLHHLAYVIYTSGTTGKPKGVMIEHRSLTNSALEGAKLLQIQPGTKTLQFFSMNFDAMVLEWTSSLIQGATLYLLSRRYPVLESLQLVLRVHPIEVAALTPGVLRTISEKHLAHLKTLCVGGEALDTALVEKWQTKCCLINSYGPAENTVHTTAHIYQAADHLPGACIGKPIGNTQLYVLDENKKLLPIGVPGELYIGGIGLARGYLNQPQLTIERFIWHKFNEDSEPMRLYRTGDCVSYLPDGNIEYMGRIDNQIKIRGFRVELEEIEAQLLKHAAITAAAVIVREEADNKQLVAYLVVEGIDVNKKQEQNNFIQQLKAQLATFLPNYMIPVHMMLIEKMPLTFNGKVDRKVLCELPLEILSEETYLAPTTDTEKQLAILWSEILHVPVAQIGLNDNFFEIGGHSLLLIQLLHQVKNTLAIDISLVQFYANPTIRGSCQASSALLQIDPSLIPLTPQKTENPLFLIHSVVGLAGHYASLVPALQDYALYGVNYENMLDGRELKTYPSLEALARDYIAKIKTVAPHGPYRLGGWSLGGIIALEMSRQLQTAGEKVEIVLLLDAVYHVNVEMEDFRYMRIFMQSLLGHLDEQFLKQSQAVERFAQVAYHLHKLLLAYKAQPLNQLIDKVVLIKCQGALIQLSEQKKESLEWGIVDFFNGLKHFFSSEQRLHVRTIACNHYELFDESHRDLLNTHLKTTLWELDEQTYSLDEHKQFDNFIRAIEHGDAFALRRLLAENAYTSIADTDARGHNLLDIAYDHHQMTIASYLLKQSSMLRTNYSYQWLTLEDDIEQPSSLLNIDQSDVALRTISLLRRHYRVNLSHILSILCKQLTPEMSQSLLMSLVELSPSYILTSITNLIKNIVMLHLISENSLDLVAAAVIDDVILALPFAIAVQCNSPMLNYINQGLDSHSPQKVGRAFDAGLYLSLSMLLPIVIYSVFAQELVQAMGVQSPIANTLGQLARARLLAVIPMLINITLEQYYAIRYQRYQSSIGTLLDTLFTVGAFALLRQDNTFNARTLGYAIGIGSFSKFVYYLHNLIHQGDFQHYTFGQNFSWATICQYWHDSRKLAFSTTLPFINYFMLAILISRDRGNLELTGYKVLRMVFEVTTVLVPVITATSHSVMSRFFFSNQHENVLALGMITLGMDLVLATIPSIAFESLNGKTITNTFISLNQIPLFMQPTFFDSIKVNISYFIGLGLSNTLQIPLISYLITHVAFEDILKTHLLTYLLLTNIGLLGMYYGHGSKINDLIKITLVGNLLTTLLLLYQWLKISGFQLAMKEKRSSNLAREKNRARDTNCHDATLTFASYSVPADGHCCYSAILIALMHGFLTGNIAENSSTAHELLKKDGLFDKIVQFGGITFPSSAVTVTERFQILFLREDPYRTLSMILVPALRSVIAHYALATTGSVRNALCLQCFEGQEEHHQKKFIQYFEQLRDTALDQSIWGGPADLEVVMSMYHVRITNEEKDLLVPSAEELQRPHFIIHHIRGAHHFEVKLPAGSQRSETVEKFCHAVNEGWLIVQKQQNRSSLDASSKQLPKHGFYSQNQVKNHLNLTIPTHRDDSVFLTKGGIS